MSLAEPSLRRILRRPVKALEVFARRWYDDAHYAKNVIYVPSMADCQNISCTGDEMFERIPVRNSAGIQNRAA